MMMSSKKEIYINKKNAFLVACILGFLFGMGLAVTQSLGESRSRALVAGGTGGWEQQGKMLKMKDEELKEMKEKLTIMSARQEELEQEVLTLQDRKSVNKGNDRHAVWKPSTKKSSKDPDLAKVLEKVANDNAEVMVAVSDINYARPGGMLDLWMSSVQRAGVKNAMVIALDDETKKNVEEKGITAFKMKVKIPESQKDLGSNHAVSALKFRILQRFMNLGYSVLLSDVDVITLKNPFDHLVRDSDVESMSDGWTEEKAYGYNDVMDDASMGWARYAHSMRIFVFNSGLFYLRPTTATMELLDKLIHRIETENGWDQALFNECIFFPNSPTNKVRVDPICIHDSMIISAHHLQNKLNMSRNVHRILLLPAVLWTFTSL